MTKLQVKTSRARSSRRQIKESHKIVWVGNKRYGTPRFLKPFIKKIKAMRLKGSKLRLRKV